MLLATGEYIVEQVVMLARELSGMSGAQQKRAIKEIERNPSLDVKAVVEEAKVREKITQIIVTVDEDLWKAVHNCADAEGITLDEAMKRLVSKTLKGETTSGGGA